MKNEPVRVVIFDFCETLIKFQTANAFVSFVCSRPGNKTRGILYALYTVINKTKIISLIYFILKGYGGGKRIPAFFLKGLERKQIEKYAEDFYQEQLKPAIISPVVKDLIENKSKGFLIGIISGGYYEYINVFAKNFPVDFIIANRLEYVNEKCTGKYGEDYMGANKVCAFKQKFQDEVIDVQNSWFYTDSITDMPLLNEVGNKVVVSKCAHQDWANKSNEINKEIIWEL